MNDLGFVNENKPTARDENLLQVASARAEHEVQAAFVIAKKFPRNEMTSYSKIIDACKRPYLAEKACYAYPRGGTMVTGASIRLAEAMAAAWGNIECGVRELSQANGQSVAEAYAIDLETNTRKSLTFTVKHERHTRKGITKLTDMRDIYEMVANQGARRLRACILAILPGDVVEAAVEQCRKTLESSDVPINEQIKKMVIAFDEFGVKVEHLEKRLGHNLNATIPAEIVTLKSIYRSLKDGMATREDFFEIAGAQKKEVEEAQAEIKALLSKGKEKEVKADENGEIKN